MKHESNWAESPRLSTREAAEYLGVQPSTLEGWRFGRIDRQPNYFKVGRRVYYLRSDLDAFIEASRRGGDA